MRPLLLACVTPIAQKGELVTPAPAPRMSTHRVYRRGSIGSPASPGLKDVV